MATADSSRLRLPHAVFVYGWTQRLWHWVTAAALLVLFITGYYIGLPPDSIGSQFGWMRTLHFIAGWVLTLGFAYRVYLGLVGGPHAREILYLPVWQRSFWVDLVEEFKWYAFLRRRPEKHIGHNPLARVAMFTLFTGGTVFMIITGLALYGEGEGQGSWTFRLFGWLLSVPGGSLTLHTAHRLGMWSIVLFTMTHLYAALREDIMSRQTTMSTIMSGWRMFKDDED